MAAADKGDLASSEAAAFASVHGKLSQIFSLLKVAGELATEAQLEADRLSDTIEKRISAQSIAALEEGEKGGQPPP